MMEHAGETIALSAEASSHEELPSNLKDRKDFQSLHNRFTAIESKINMVDSIFDLQQAVQEITDEEPTLDPTLDFSTSNSGAFTMRQHRNFFFDTLYFMNRMRKTHEALVQNEKKGKKTAAAAARAKSGWEFEPEHLRQVCTEAFLSGKGAKMVQADWETFIAWKSGLDESILSPIEVISTEPEPQMILQLRARLKKSSKAKPSGHCPAETFAARDNIGDTLGQRPLPERIKVHSGPLAVIFSRVIDDDNWTLAKDNSMVFTRPFKELIYHQNQFREWTTRLEKRFEHYDGTQDAHRKVVVPDEDGNNQGEEPKDNNTERSTKLEEDENEDKKNDEGNKEAEEEAKSNSLTALLHLRCLMDFVDNNINARIEYINSRSCTHVFFQDLWHLFKPGDKIVDQTEKQAYVILRVSIPRHRVEEPWRRWHKIFRRRADRMMGDKSEDDSKDGNSVALYCVYVDFDGKLFGPVSKTFKIPQFGELKDVRTLPAYPFRFARNTGLQQEFIERGNMMLDVARFKSMYYMGMTLNTQEEIDSQVVVDFHEALADEERRKLWEPKIEPINSALDDDDYDSEGACTSPCCHEQAIHDGEDIDSTMTKDFVNSLVSRSSLRAPSLILSPRPFEDMQDPKAEVTEEELIIMTYRVFGFVLRSRKWAQLDLTFLRYENADARSSTVNAFERLELPSGHRQVVKSLVIQHFRSRQTSFTRDEQTDLIKGKGKGLILLLHGAPGVGKTTTAEGIAELFRKPLFQITCGDLGTTAREVEAELEKNFALASRWGCILLLDEADVFLSARERKDFARNGLVSVFLRVLEYYTGILFLTTNRIGDFDEAFASRIHMSLYYPSLDEDKTLKVFKLNLELIKNRFDQQGREIIFDSSSIEEFAKQHYKDHKYNRWNGRQIRNLCQTAIALAEFDAQGGDIDGEIDRKMVVQLQLKHFQTVQEAYVDFGKYLGDIRGTRGDRRAVDHQLRARQDTPYQTKPSQFSQRAEEMASGSSRVGHGLTSVSSSNVSHHRHTSQGDPFQPFNQGYPLPGLAANGSPHVYHQYLSPQSQIHEQPTGPIETNMRQMSIGSGIQNNPEYMRNS